MHSSIRAQRFQLIDISIPAGFAGSNINIPDQPMLRNVRIQAIEVYTQEDFPLSPVTGNNIADVTQCKYTSVTLYTADPVSENDTGEYFYRIPFLTMHNLVNADTTPYTNRALLLDDISVQWEKCSLNFTQPIDPNANTSYLIGVYYTTRKERTLHLLSKKLSGIGEGAFTDMLMTKIMQLEQSLQNITNRLTGR